MFTQPFILQMQVHGCKELTLHIFSCVGILSLLLVVVVVVTTTVLVVRPGKTKLVSQWKTKPKWRSVGEPFCPVDCVCNGDRSVGLTSEILVCFICVSGW